MSFLQVSSFRFGNQSLSLPSIVYLLTSTNFVSPPFFHCSCRAESYSLPKFDFSDFGLRNLIRHAKIEHPGAWMNQRTGQTDIDPIQ